MRKNNRRSVWSDEYFMEGFTRVLAKTKGFPPPEHTPHWHSLETHTDTHISFWLSLSQHYVRLSFFNPAVKHEWKKTSRCGDAARCRCAHLYLARPHPESSSLKRCEFPVLFPVSCPLFCLQTTVVASVFVLFQWCCFPLVPSFNLIICVYIYDFFLRHH